MLFLRISAYLKKQCSVKVDALFYLANRNDVRIDFKLQFADVQFPKKVMQFLWLDLSTHRITNQPVRK